MIAANCSRVPNGIGHVYAFDKNTGAIRWKYRTSDLTVPNLRLDKNLSLSFLKLQPPRVY